MKFNKNGEKPKIKSNRNIRFDENGHIIVQNPSAYWLPSITTKQTIGGTEYIAINDHFDTIDPNSTDNDMAGIKNWFNDNPS